MRTIIATTIVVLTTSWVFDSPAIGPQMPPLAKFDGTWTIVSVERDPPEKRGEQFRCVINDGRAKIYLPSEDKPAGALTFKVDSTATPKTMDIRPDGEQIWLHAIYKLDGDKLTICWKSIEEKRPPTEFTSKAGTGQTVVTLERQKR